MTALIIYRLQDGFGNKSTLSVGVRNDTSIRYSLYGSWQPNGTHYAISNLQLKKSLPSFLNSKTTELLDAEITSVLETGVEKIISRETPLPVVKTADKCKHRWEKLNHENGIDCVWHWCSGCGTLKWKSPKGKWTYLNPVRSYNRGV